MKKCSLISLARQVCIGTLLLGSSSSFASHIVGADLFYTHMTGNTYKITVVLYGDCGPSSAGSFATFPSSSPRVCIYDGATLSTSIDLPINSPTAGVEVTPLCPGDTSQCTNMSSVTPGIKKFTYSDTITLPHTSSVWRFVYNGYNGGGAAAGRAASITNLASVAGTNTEIVDTLNNSTYNNSSPVLTVSQQTFFCNAQHCEYTPGAVDPDGDSLVIDLAGAVGGAGGSTCTSSGGLVSYTGTAWPGTPVSAAIPLQVLADSFTLDNSTGKLSFHPNVYQRGIVVYNIREYRSGVLVGTSQREMTVLVLNCASGFDCYSTAYLNLPKADDKTSTSVYPNPATGELNIKAESGYSTYNIVNTAGRSIMSGQLIAGSARLNIRSLPAGLYYITLKGQQGSAVQKFIKE